MRLAAFCILTLGLLAPPAMAQRTDSSPLVRAAPTVAPCLQACETEFAGCESRPQATDGICPQSRRLCFERCDPAVLSSETLKGLKRTPEELRQRPIRPPTPVEQCRQGCQDRRATCLASNGIEACDPATSACYDRCDARHAPKAKPAKPR